MKIVGLITEYNPFHNGHLYHLEQALDITGADAAIALMSGNYVQRGAPAIMPKHLRAQVALEAGVSIWSWNFPSATPPVARNILPPAPSPSSSAWAAWTPSVSAANAGITPFWNGSLRSRQKNRKNTASPCRKPSGRECLFPLARQMALKQYFRDELPSEILEQPNNILGIEYIKALRRQNSPIKAYTIKRKVSGYHDDTSVGKLQLRLRHPPAPGGCRQGHPPGVRGPL